MIKLKWWTLLLCAMAAETAKILVVIPFPAKSHYICTRNIGLELARRGHEVHVISTHVEKQHPDTYHEIVIEYKNIWSLLGVELSSAFDIVDTSYAEFQNMVYNGGVAFTEFVLQSPSVQKLMAEDHNFDLVISELYYQQSLYMFAHYYNAPLVLVTTFGNSFNTNYFTRNPLQLSTMMHEFGRIENPGSLWGRLKNLYYCVYDILMVMYSYLPRHERLVKKYFQNLKEPVPSLEQLTANASLVLMNSHFSADGPGTYWPNAVEIGGFHLDEAKKPLTADLQNFLDSAAEGVVLVSFGSNVKSSELPASKRDAILNVFKRLKQKVLWKWEVPDIPGKPDNVEIRQWLPQKEVLAHPNVKLFFAHGGLIGLQEALYYGVPILGMPIYGDQFNNLLQAKKDGYAEIIEYVDINEETLENNLIKMLNNEDYNKNAKEISKRYKDRPMTGLETAMFWIEYVIRNDGASYMKSPGLNMNLLSFHMLDIIVLLLFVMLAKVFVFYKFYKIVKRKFIKLSNSKKKTN